jgi:DNA repair exonuclease SbcCD nuclease subunit
MKKIAHLSDIHFSRDSQKLALESLSCALEVGKRENIDAWVFAGDLYDRGIQNTKNSGLPQLVNIIQAMLDVAPILSVEGTVTHDLPGCYEILEKIKAKHQFYNLRPDKPQIISDILFLGLPEVTKEWFLKDKQLGGDEANEAIKEGMRKILLGLGAQRKDYPDIPCLFIGHLSIAGATMANGQIVPGREITIGRDDLALVGADYYALGHIHLAQQIGDLPAYYAGSAYPVNWGEVDQKRFNLVELFAGGESIIQLKDFPYPPRKKIIADSQLMKDDNNYAGFQTWMVVKGSKEELATINTDQALEYLIEQGALLGSRVTIEIITTETLRAGEITEAKRLRDKLKIYAESSEQELVETIYEKADTLELAAQKEDNAPRGAHIRNDKLCLRGAEGIRKGLGLEEITIDFSQYDEDLIALIGPNGTGKTTLIENMHPYVEIFTRGGKLQDHFYLKDSWRDLYFTDEKTGDKYRAFIQIDGANQTGKCEYHLYKNGEPITNGRKEDYEQKINGIFGSLALYLRGAFSSQKATKTNPDLGEATKGEKKALFRELGGLDYLQLHAESAKEKAKNIESYIIRDQGRIETLEQLVAVLPEKENNHAIHVGILADEKKVLAGIEAEGKSYRKTKEDLQKRVDKHREVDMKLISASKREEELREEHYDTCASIDGYKQALEGKEDAVKNEAKYAELKAEYDKLDAEYRDAKEAASNTEREIQAKKAKASEKLAEHNQKKAVLVQKVDNLNSLLAEKITCPKCNHVFSRDQAELEARLEETHQKIFDLDVDMKVPAAALKRRSIELEKFVWPTEAAKATIEGEMLYIDIELYKKTIADANIAEAKIEEAQKRFVAINEQQAELKAQIRELKDKLDPEAGDLYTQATTDLQVAIDKYNECKQSIAGIKASIMHIEGEIADIEEKKAQLEELKKATEASIEEMIEWQEHRGNDRMAVSTASLRAGRNPGA